MKKILLLPKTDTVIICLPEQWVGTPVICKLEPVLVNHINFEEVETEAERMIVFINKKRRKKNK
ncbi:MAG: hypothetical protein FWF70_05085 [Bacteroidetes bacterium]|nr:hypothetical protein [Bacteroidota bacterium]MCL1969076.1 hypothetical protein [Bacteroidota bacterium]